jgi:hypothetical protein
MTLFEIYGGDNFPPRFSPANYYFNFAPHSFNISLNKLHIIESSVSLFGGITCDPEFG